MRINTMLFVLLASAAMAGYASAATNIGACSYTVSGNGGNYSVQNDCALERLAFADGTAQARVRCTSPSPQITGVVFGNNTYNNTIVNCTFANADVSSMRKAFNNVVSPRGSYSFTFSNNESNIALGYNFVFIPKTIEGWREVEAYASTAPLELAREDFGKFNNQNLDIDQVHDVAARINFTLPRFGVHLPTRELSGVTFELEALQLSKNGTKSFNPYWFVCPYWGYDILSYYRFNITHDMEYTPMYLSPEMSTNIQMPDNTDVFWNYTVRNFGNATNVTAYIFPSYQFSGAKPIKTISNFSFATGRLSYDAGVLSKGMHQFITVFNSVRENAFEQSNSTTLNSATGLSFCTEFEPPIRIPGYYSMAFNDLTLLDVYHPSGRTCGVSVTIVTDNVTIDCKGGTINSTIFDFQILSSRNVTVQNCVLRGNALNAQSSNVIIANSTLIANNESNIALSAYSSNVFLMNTTFSGYGNQTNMVESTLSILEPSAPTSTVPQSTIAQTTMAQTNVTQQGTGWTGDSYYLFYFALLFGVLGAALVAYSFLCSRQKRMRRARARVHRRKS